MFCEWMLKFQKIVSDDMLVFLHVVRSYVRPCTLVIAAYGFETIEELFVNIKKI